MNRTFHLQYQALGESNWSEITVAESSGLGRQSVDIAGLEPDVEYVLRMFASNAAGASSTTQNIYFSIKGSIL